MPPAVVTVWFDYACPHSYLGLGQLEELASTLGFDIDRRPFLVRSDSLEKGHSPRDLENRERDGSKRRPLYKPGEGLVIEPASNRSVSTLAVQAATAYAKERGLDGRFYWAASREYWEQGTDLGSLYTLRRLAVSVGLDWGKMWPNLDSGDYHKLVLAQHEAAKEDGVARAPSFRIGGKLHSGPMDAEELRAAVQVAK
ncbi:MAG: DsbA family protein [Chloroflexi bacterium]|nr:DsbA family protein [Chloroflexota bacterium]